MHINGLASVYQCCVWLSAGEWFKFPAILVLARSTDHMPAAYFKLSGQITGERKNKIT